MTYSHYWWLKMRNIMRFLLPFIFSIIILLLVLWITGLLGGVFNPEPLFR